MHRFSLACAGLVLLAAGCDAPEPAIRLVVDFSDLAVPDDVDELRLRVWSGERDGEPEATRSFGRDDLELHADDWSVVIVRTDSSVEDISVDLEALGPNPSDPRGRARVSRGVLRDRIAFDPSQDVTRTFAFLSDPGCVDRDGDGAASGGPGCVPWDCDDYDDEVAPVVEAQPLPRGEVMPGRIDECGDGVDSDCDGFDAWYRAQPEAWSDGDDSEIPQTPCGWYLSGRCAGIEFPCIDGEWICPELDLGGEADECATGIDENCDGAVDLTACRCEPGTVRPEERCEPCGTNVCVDEGTGYECRDNDPGFVEGEACVPDEGCADGSWQCVFDEEAGRYVPWCAGKPRQEVCNDQEAPPLDEDCDDLVNGDDNWSCPLGDAPAASCVVPEEDPTRHCWRSLDGSRTVCPRPLAVVLDILPDPAPERIDVQFVGANCDPSCNYTIALDAVEGDTFLMGIVISCSLDAENLPDWLDSTVREGAIIEGESLVLTLTASVANGPCGEEGSVDCGVYQEFLVEVPLQAPGFGELRPRVDWLPDTIDVSCTLSRP